MSAKQEAQIQYQKDHKNDTQVPKIVGALAFSLAISYIAVLLRLLSRRLSRTELKMDDWVIVFSLALTTAYHCANLSLIPVGIGRHEILVTKPITLTKTLLACEVLYTFAIAAFKTSMLFLLHRVFPGKRFRFILISIGTFIMAYSVVQACCAIFACRPVRAQWEPKVEGHCIQVAVVFLVISALNIATDFIILALPMPILWRLKITKMQKLQLTALFTMGSLVCIISIVRITTLKDVSLVDPSYSDAVGLVWSSLEQAFGTLSACLPTFRPLFHHCLGRGPKPAGQRKHRGKDSLTGEQPGMNGTMQDSVASDRHPFAKLPEEPNADKEWKAHIPMNVLDKHSVAGNNERMPQNVIAVQTDLEQRTSIRRPTSAVYASKQSDGQTSSS